MQATDLLSIGAISQRAGVAVSALRFYESQGLLTSVRSEGGHRLFARATLRRIAFIRAAQSVGLALPQIQAALASLPAQRTPTPQDWQALSQAWLPALDAQIQTLQRLREQLTSCIGCGCLSLKACPLYNADDQASQRGAGPRYWMGDRALQSIDSQQTDKAHR